MMRIFYIFLFTIFFSVFCHDQQLISVLKYEYPESITIHFDSTLKGKKVYPYICHSDIDFDSIPPLPFDTDTYTIHGKFGGRTEFCVLLDKPTPLIFDVPYVFLDGDSITWDFRSLPGMTDQPANLVVNFPEGTLRLSPTGLVPLSTYSRIFVFTEFFEQKNKKKLPHELTGFFIPKSVEENIEISVQYGDEVLLNIVNCLGTNVLSNRVYNEKSPPNGSTPKDHSFNEIMERYFPKTKDHVYWRNGVSNLISDGFLMGIDLDKHRVSHEFECLPEYPWVKCRMGIGKSESVGELSPSSTFNCSKGVCVTELDPRIDWNQSSYSLNVWNTHETESFAPITLKETIKIDNSIVLSSEREYILVSSDFMWSLQKLHEKECKLS